MEFNTNKIQHLFDKEYEKFKKSEYFYDFKFSQEEIDSILLKIERVEKYIKYNLYHSSDTTAEDIIEDDIGQMLMNLEASSLNNLKDADKPWSEANFEGLWRVRSGMTNCCYWDDDEGDLVDLDAYDNAYKNLFEHDVSFLLQELEDHWQMILYRYRGMQYMKMYIMKLKEEMNKDQDGK